MILEQGKPKGLERKELKWKVGTKDATVLSLESLNMKQTQDRANNSSYDPRRDLEIKRERSWNQHIEKAYHRYRKSKPRITPRHSLENFQTLKIKKKKSSQGLQAKKKKIK